MDLTISIILDQIFMQARGWSFLSRWKGGGSGGGGSVLQMGAVLLLLLLLDESRWRGKKKLYDKIQTERWRGKKRNGIGIVKMLFSWRKLSV